jgi:hypothetical protein
MTVEQHIEQEANEQIEDIKRMFPDMGEQELKYISLCLKQCYVKGAKKALSLAASKTEIK